MEVMAQDAVLPHPVDDNCDPVLATARCADFVRRDIGVVPSLNHCCC
jgi:hypothetical protein